MTPEELDAGLKELIRRGEVEMTWDEEKNDFVYYLTEKGKDVVKAQKRVN